MKMTIDKNVLDAIAQYLVKRPYAEVAALLGALSKAEPVGEKSAEKAPQE